jgi:predicted benzoate:H+ symporter BenE
LPKRAGNGFIFAASRPVAIILAVSARGDLSESYVSLWIFGSFFINGLITLSRTAVFIRRVTGTLSGSASKGRR